MTQKLTPFITGVKHYTFQVGLFFLWTTAMDQSNESFYLRTHNDEEENHNLP